MLGSEGSVSMLTVAAERWHVDRDHAQPGPIASPRPPLTRLSKLHLVGNVLFSDHDPTSSCQLTACSAMVALRAVEGPTHGSIEIQALSCPYFIDS